MKQSHPPWTGPLGRRKALGVMMLIAHRETETSEKRKMSLELNSDRRRFLRGSAMAVIASDLAMTSSSKAEVDKMAAQTVPPIKSGTHTSFPSLKQINAGALSVTPK